MPMKLTEQDARESLGDHVARKGSDIFARYGPDIGWQELQLIINDPEFVRYPCTIEFDDEPLQEGECAYPLPISSRPEDGYTMVVHPYFLNRLEFVPHVVFYQLVAINYGDFAGSVDAEKFGSSALGIPVDEYYHKLCTLSDSIGDAHTPAD